jgi:hypothetical protein
MSETLLIEHLALAWGVEDVVIGTDNLCINHEKIIGGNKETLDLLNCAIERAAEGIGEVIREAIHEEIKVLQE